MVREMCIVAKPGSSIPVGSVLAPSNGVGQGHRLVPCDGREMSIDAFPELYAVVGNTFGGSPHLRSFRVPDLTVRIDVPRP